MDTASVWISCVGWLMRGPAKSRADGLDGLPEAALRHPQNDAAVALAGGAQRLEPGHDARIEPDMQAAILGALRLNSDRSEL
jgi:hypothetical protein